MLRRRLIPNSRPTFHYVSGRSPKYDHCLAMFMAICSWRSGRSIASLDQTGLFGTDTAIRSPSHRARRPTNQTKPAWNRFGMPRSESGE
jgi:hypothetical protein